jgi:hypothetical protein
VRHERRRELYVGRVPGCDAVREMKVGPSEPPGGGRLQTTTCCGGHGRSW